MDGIPSPIQHVLDLFATDLAEVRFADVDGPTLARLAAQVKAESEAVQVAQASLEGARRALEERQEALLHHVQRALAYARVYAESDEALSRRLEAIALPRGARRVRGADDALVLSPVPQKAGRPRTRTLKFKANAEADADAVTG